MGDGWSAPRPGRFTLGERPGTHCIEGWVVPIGPVWTGAENLAPTGIQLHNKGSKIVLSFPDCRVNFLLIFQQQFSSELCI
jgi:hypothetical protein